MGKRGIAKSYSIRYAHMIGKTFGRLTVIRILDEVHPHTGVPFVCKCVCGKEKIVGRYHLMRSAIKSCGCLRTGNKIGLQGSFAVIQ